MHGSSATAAAPSSDAPRQRTRATSRPRPLPPLALVAPGRRSHRHLRGIGRGAERQPRQDRLRRPAGASVRRQGRQRQGRQHQRPHHRSAHRRHQILHDRPDPSSRGRQRAAAPKSEQGRVLNAAGQHLLDLGPLPIADRPARRVLRVDARRARYEHPGVRRGPRRQADAAGRAGCRQQADTGVDPAACSGARRTLCGADETGRPVAGQGVHHRTTQDDLRRRCRLQRRQTRGSRGRRLLTFSRSFFADRRPHTEGRPPRRPTGHGQDVDRTRRRG